MHFHRKMRPECDLISRTRTVICLSASERMESVSRLRLGFFALSQSDRNVRYHRNLLRFFQFHRFFSFLSLSLFVEKCIFTPNLGNVDFVRMRCCIVLLFCSFGLGLGCFDFCISLTWLKKGKSAHFAVFRNLRQMTNCNDLTKQQHTIEIIEKQQFE